MLVNTLAINDLLNGTMETAVYGGEAFLEELVYQWELIKMPLCSHIVIAYFKCKHQDDSEVQCTMKECIECGDEIQKCDYEEDKE